MRIKHQILLTVSTDDDEKVIEFKRAEQVSTTVVRSDCAELIHQTAKIEKQTVDWALPFGKITSGKFLYLESDIEVKVKINGSPTEYKVTPTTGAKGKLLWDGAFTGITISNASTTVDAVVTYLLGGD